MVVLDFPGRKPPRNNSRTKAILPQGRYGSIRVRADVSFKLEKTKLKSRLTSAIAPYFKQRPVPVPSLINPGAGLRHLDFSHDSDFIFDSIFSAHTDYTLPDVGSIDNRSADSYSEQALLIVREYDSDRDM